mgnify:CR=1 FL=1
MLKLVDLLLDLLLILSTRESGIDVGKKPIEIKEPKICIRQITVLKLNNHKIAKGKYLASTNFFLMHFFPKPKVALGLLYYEYT